MSNSGWQQAKNILCIRLDYLGDVLMCTPAIRALRESLPGRDITLLTSGSGAAVVPFIPEIDDVIIYAPPWMKSSPPYGADYQMAMVETLRSRRFDAAVIFTTFTQSPLPAALLCFLAGIPLRLAHCRENPYQMLTDWVPDPDKDPAEGIRHEVRRQLDLVATVGAAPSKEQLSFAVRDEDEVWVRQWLAQSGFALTKPWVLMHPGATASSRRYPPEYWVEAIKQLNKAHGLSILLTGDPSEAELIDSIIRASGISSAHVLSAAGKLDLGKLGAAIRIAPVMVSNNTGPAHMAAAVGTPIVELYALTNPQHTPWAVDSRVLFHDVPCRNCYKSVCPQGHHHCLTLVEPHLVVDSVLDMLQRHPERLPKLEQALAEPAV